MKAHRLLISNADDAESLAGVHVVCFTAPRHCKRGEFRRFEPLLKGARCEECVFCAGIARSRDACTVRHLTKVLQCIIVGVDTRLLMHAGSGCLREREPDRDARHPKIVRHGTTLIFRSNQLERQHIRPTVRREALQNPILQASGVPYAALLNPQNNCSLSRSGRSMRTW